VSGYLAVRPVGVRRYLVGSPALVVQCGVSTAGVTSLRSSRRSPCGRGPVWARLGGRAVRFDGGEERLGDCVVPAGGADKRGDQVIYYQYKADRARRTLRGIDEQVANHLTIVFAAPGHQPLDRADHRLDEPGRARPAWRDPSRRVDALARRPGRTRAASCRPPSRAKAGVAWAAPPAAAAGAGRGPVISRRPPLRGRRRR
jgi:hypothetical protein